MEITKPLPREKYTEHLQNLSGQCAFCTMSSDLNIRESEYWIWAYAAFPYRKYHTLLIAKRHVTHFSELNPSELLEFSELTGQIEDTYRKSTVINSDSLYGNQLYISWRSRFIDEGKKSVAHLHIHFYPRFANELETVQDPNSWDIDPALLSI